MLVLEWRRLRYCRGADGWLKPASMLHLFKYSCAGTIRIIHLHALSGVLWLVPPYLEDWWEILDERMSREKGGLVGF